MRDDLESKISRLVDENRQLASNIESLTSELKEVRSEARDRRHENKRLAAQFTDLATERDLWKVKAETDPDSLRAQIADLGSRLRAEMHERAYESVARGLKVTDPMKFADLVKLASHQSDGDEPDTAKVTASFQEALKARPWLVDAEECRPTQAYMNTVSTGAIGNLNDTTAADPGPGADRGQSLSSSSCQPERRAIGRL
jgi:hypothetical protein